MNAYASLFQARFRALIQYRAAAAAGIGTQLFWGMLRVMIFEAFYRSTTAPQPISFRELVSYLWLIQAMFGMLPWQPDGDVREMIRTGTVAYEMLRPLDVYGAWYARAVAQRSAPTLLRAVPQFIIAGLFFGLHAPPSFASAGAWVLATFGALLLSASLAMLITVSLLWTISGEGIARIVPTLVYFLSGMVLPLPLFPDWAQTLLNFLPFRGLFDAPFRLYVGNIPPGQFGLVLAHQLLWTLAIVAVGRGLLAKAQTRMVIQGG